MYSCKKEKKKRFWVSKRQNKQLQKKTRISSWGQFSDGDDEFFFASQGRLGSILFTSFCHQISQMALTFPLSKRRIETPKITTFHGKKITIIIYESLKMVTAISLGFCRSTFDHFVRALLHMGKKLSTNSRRMVNEYSNKNFLHRAAE